MEKNILTLEEAAAYLGVTTDELMLSFWKGLPPGNQAEKKDGRLTWDRRNLIPPPRTRTAPAVDTPHICAACGKEYRTVRGLKAHIEREGH